MYNIILFIALLTTWLYFDMKISRIISCLAFKEQQTKKDVKFILLIGFISIISWTIYIAL